MGMQKIFSPIILFLISISAFAETRIAILDFELKDLTLVPRTPAEINRTASIKPSNLRRRIM
jgi:hypothetical protein